MEPDHHHHDAPQLTATVRDATPDDVPALAALHLSSWRSAYSGIVPQAWLSAVTLESRLERWEQALRAPASERQTIVADAGGTITGLCELGVARDDDVASGCGEIIALHVRPESRGRGVGTLLLDAAISRLHHMGRTHAVLWVIRDNADACRFYEARGWHRDGAERVEHRGDASIPEVRYRIIAGTTA